MPRDRHTVHSSATSLAAKSVDALTDKGRRTRASLVEAAARVFERERFVDVRVTDVADEAGAAHGTFYKYFASKEEIFLAVIEAHQSAIEQAARKSLSRETTSVRAAVEASNRAYLEGYGNYWRLMRSWAEAAAVVPSAGELLDELTSFNIERTQRSLEDLKRKGVVADDLDPALAACALNAMVMNFAISVFRHGPDGVDMDAAVRTVTDIWCRGIGLQDNARRS